MARIDIRDQINFDRTTVFDTFRDDLEALADYLPDIREIERLEHERRDENTVHVVRVWKAQAEDKIPSIASKWIKPEQLQWTDHATWHEDEYRCDWTMEVGFATEAVSCSGTTYYRDADNDGRTEVHITGELKVDAKKLGVPRLVAGKVSDAVEALVVKLITPNLKEVNRGAEKYLQDQGI